MTEQMSVTKLEHQYLSVAHDANVLPRVSDFWIVKAKHVESFEHASCIVEQDGVAQNFILFDAGGNRECLSNSVSIFGVLLLGLCNVPFDPVAAYTRTLDNVALMTEMLASTTPKSQDLSKFLPFFLFLAVVICGLQAFIIWYAFRPAKKVLEGLNCLARGNFSYRLPNFKLFAFHRISDGFNRFAADVEQKLRHKDALLVDGLEQERTRLARELHDELAQTCVGMSAVIESLRISAQSECPKLLHEANKLQQISASLQTRIGATLRNLRLSQIDDIGFLASLTELMKSHKAYAGGKLKISLEVCGDLHDINRQAAAHIYRVVQEGLTNITKHSTADRARVRLKYYKASSGQMAWLIMMIEDNGSSAANRNVAVNTGLGLVGMRERVSALGGRLKVLTNSQTGFRICVLIPFYQ